MVTGTNMFFRSAGSAVGVAVFGAIVNATLGATGVEGGRVAPAALTTAVHHVFLGDGGAGRGDAGRRAAHAARPGPDAGVGTGGQRGSGRLTASAGSPRASSAPGGRSWSTPGAGVQEGLPLRPPAPSGRQDEQEDRGQQRGAAPARSGCAASRTGTTPSCCPAGVREERAPWDQRARRRPRFRAPAGCPHPCGRVTQSDRRARRLPDRVPSRPLRVSRPATTGPGTERRRSVFLLGSGEVWGQVG